LIISAAPRSQAGPPAQPAPSGGPGSPGGLPPWPPLVAHRPPVTAADSPPASAAMTTVAAAVPQQRFAADDTVDLPIYRALSSWFAESGRGMEWTTAADAGWQAAAAAATPGSAGITPSGMPIRAPGAQLIPGAVNDSLGSNIVEHRDPRRTAASMAAFARGVGASRTGRTTASTAGDASRARETS